METLYKLTAAGLPLFDLNVEYLDRTDWSQTPMGARDSWPPSLACLINTCILPIPHPTAIFWGKDLAVAHNLAWGKATGKLDGQGARAVDSYSDDAVISLQSSLRGRTAKVGSRFFLAQSTKFGPDETVLLSTIVDERGIRQGVLAQLLHNLPLQGLDGIARKKGGQRVKPEDAQQYVALDSEPQVDSKQTQLFQRFAELVPNGLAILDSDAEAVFVNDGFFALTTNRTSKDFRAWPFSIDQADYERVMAEYRIAFSSRQELRVEFRCAGETTAEEREWRLFLLRPLSEEPEAGFICAVVDITEIKQAQLAQEKAATEAQERKAQQERFIDMVSHEIRNPLSAVLHLAEEVKGIVSDLTRKVEGVQDELLEIKDAAEIILLCVHHQNTLVDDILSFSKLDAMMLSLVPRVVKPKWEFSTALKVFRSEFKAKDIQFHYAMDVSYDDAEVEYVIADVNRMKQVLVNLITNAIKFTAKKNGERKITVSMGASMERPTSYPPNVIYFGNEDKAVLHIDSTKSVEWGRGTPWDTGIGISSSDQKKLFERFRQATPKTQEKYGGSGLGLFISRKLCQLHGGDVGVSSKDGEGSTFGFFFRVRRSDGTGDGGRPTFGTRPSDRSSSPSRSSQTIRPSFKRALSSLANIKEGPRKQTDQKPSERVKETSGGIGNIKIGPLEQEDQKVPKQPSKETSKQPDRGVVDQEDKSPTHFQDKTLGRQLDKAPAKNSDDGPHSPTLHLPEKPKKESLPSHGVVHVDDGLKNPPTESHGDTHPRPSRDERYCNTKKLVNEVEQEEPLLKSSTSSQPPDFQSGETARQKEKAKLISRGQSEKGSDANLVILLVEDNLINQKVLRRQLQSRLFEVVVANDGQEAVDAVEERGRLDESNWRRNYFDIILMDQEMPIMDGNTATREIRLLQAHGKAGSGETPILGVSANVREAQTKSMIESGMNAVISKPFKVDDLVKKIQSLLPDR
ncbi:hypothetical protein K504DRAFT_469383 [Pleomassaria siparia CBS 279.74]|uniref:histidine kinase n=1 Tax=Pleomassaria siparia CBS 279.74 TaxID=1314801 RepID=A0A6G1KQE7_9PLEO|nr:hypothetical protein K504DRAFT_469383 [Pleomassaria siparia CBS 279.74]